MGNDNQFNIGPWQIPNPLGRPIGEYIPKLAQVVEGVVEGAALRAVDFVVPEERDTPDGRVITSNSDRAKEADRALVDHRSMFGNGPLVGSEDRFHKNPTWGVWRTEVWPLGQVLHGRVLQAMESGDWQRADGIFRDLEAYRSGDGYEGGISPVKERFYDDNEWLGLAAMQAYDATGDRKHLEMAERTFKFVLEGKHPDGGVYWVEQDKSARHTCSTAPAGQLAMQLFEATGKDEYRKFGEEQAEWMAKNLRSPDGVYWDAYKDTGEVVRDVYTYNQGTPLGLDVSLYRSYKDSDPVKARKFLDRAVATANATMRHFSPGDGLWKQAPVFNAVFMRNLLALSAATGDRSYVQYVDQYLDRVWNQSRNGDTGLFDLGGIGTYTKDEPGSVIDQGGLAQLYAARALPPEKWIELT